MTAATAAAAGVAELVDAIVALGVFLAAVGAIALWRTRPGGRPDQGVDDDGRAM
jgi:hypothetical protein